ncbi:MAG TPA: hypothetical protein VE866_18170 [Candidatus Binatia bacterium]|jgi:hypothetical protein|nr:hypothetical protein [Candidatus Binatia bacterium]
MFQAITGAFDAYDGRGLRYLMKNDALWKQITEKGTLAPNR